MDDFDLLPAEMRDVKRWLVWRSETNPEPTKKPRKVPYYPNGVQRHGVLDSPADRARFGSFDDALSAYKTGSFTGLAFALGPDGTGNCWQGIDLDDIPNRPALQHVAEDLPGYTEASPSGKGMHAIGYGKPFGPLGSNQTGIEAYSHGRYFTVTGIGSGIHAPSCLADFVETRLKPMHGNKPTTEAQAAPDATYEWVAPQTVTELRSALLYMRADDRDRWHRMGHALKTLGDTGRGLFLEWSATSDAFDPLADAKTWESFKPTRTGYKAVFAEAARLGWINPMSSAALGAATNYQGFDLVTSGVDSDPLASLEQSIIALNTNDSPFDALPHCVDMWVPCDEVTLLAGHGGGGKSYVALNIAVHVALGMRFGSLATTQTKVLFFSGEDGAKVLRQRLAKICRALKIDLAQLDGKLHLLDASDIDPALHREQRVLIAGRQSIVTETPLVATLAALVKKLAVGMVVVDNASDAYDDDEIKRARVRSFIRSLRSRIARPGRAVLLLAHVNKDSAKGGRNAGTEDYSGSTAWHNSVRSRLSLTPDGENAMSIVHAKANLGAKTVPVRIEWCDGVPMVAGSYHNAGSEAAKAFVKGLERAADDAAKAALVSLIQDFDKRGERVTTSAQGSATVFKLLSAQPDFPKNTDSARLMRLLRDLEASAEIFRRTVRTPDRKMKEVFTCTSAAAESAPIPESQAVKAEIE